MSVINKNIYRIIAPLVNVNDEHVTMVEWHKEHGQRVEKDDCICVIETVKSTHDIFAEEGGVLFHLAQPNDQIACGKNLGLIGEDLDAIQEHLNQKNTPTEQNTSQEIRITPKAKKLCEKHNIDINSLTSLNIKGAIKESDIFKYLNIEPTQSTVPAQSNVALHENTEKIGPLPDYNTFIAQNLKTAQQNGIFTTIETQIDLTKIKQFILEKKTQNSLLSFFHIFFWATSRALLKFPNLCTFHVNGELHRYKTIDIGFVVKTFDQKLQSPVIRDVDKKSVKEISTTCQDLNLKVNRNKATPEDIGGACMNISYIPNEKITRFVALPETFQSSIISLTANKNKAIAVLNYDHTIIDGWYAANFLSEIHAVIEDLVK